MSSRAHPERGMRASARRREHDGGPKVAAQKGKRAIARRHLRLGGRVVNFDMADPFELVSSGDLDGLRNALAADAALAASRHASGASLLAWAHYVGKADAVPIIRPHLTALDPYDAIIEGDTDAVREALAQGWDGNALSPDGFTPLALAAFFHRPAIFDLLLPLTRDVNQRAENKQRVAAIHAAAAMRNAGMIEKLLRAGADPDLAQADGFTALHSAAHHGDALTAGLLLLFGAAPRLPNDHGNDAADVAMAAGHNWLAERLSRLG
jgi:ankyrin repeat protein